MENLDIDAGVLQKLAMIERVSPEVARDIRDGLDASIVDYARRMYQLDRSPPCAPVAFYRGKLAAKLVSRAAELGVELSLQHVLDSFSEFPIIQTAPHCQLYLDPMAFWAYFVGWLGAFESGCRLIPVFNTATVTLQSAASSGPAWLSTATGAVNITTSPSSRLASTSVCAAGTAVAFDIGKLAALRGRAAPAEQRIIAALEHSIAASPHGFADATDRTNVNLIRSLSRAPISPVLFSESLICDLMADLLAERDRLIWGLLFEPARNARLHAAFERATTQLYGHFWSQATTHFWGIRDRKIRRMELRDGWLVEADRSDQGGIRVRLECDALIDALRTERLVPNLFWSFALVTILPRLSAIGGTRQIGYLNGFADVLRRTLDLADRDETELHDALGTYRLCTWGAKVIEHMPAPLTVLSTLPAGAELEALRDELRSVTLRQTTRNLQIFDGHRRWRHVPA